MEEMKKEYELKLDEYARLLDLRQARIKVLICVPSLVSDRNFHPICFC